MQKNHFSKEQIKEHSILYLMLNFPNVVKSRIEELTSISFSIDIYNDLRNEIVKFNLSDVENKNKQFVPNENLKLLIEEIEKNSTLKNIILKKDENEKVEILDELLEELKEENHMKKIKVLESEVAKNLDESSFSELIKLKNQLNRE